MQWPEGVDVDELNWGADAFTSQKEIFITTFSGANSSLQIILLCRDPTK